LVSDCEKKKKKGRNTTPNHERGREEKGL
jgi:hypothetical protein